MADQNQAQAQPIDPGVQAFTNLRVEVANIGQALAAQGVSGTISKFDGNPKFYREWIRSIEKYSLLVGAPDNRKKMIAYQQSTGAVSGFIQRYMVANPQNTWDQMKEQLSARFSDVTDAQMALSLLRQTRQKSGETIHNYAERILSLAEDAYNNQGGDAVERQLIDIFVDGLTNDQLKMKILRDQPDTLQAAVGVATNEQNLRARVQLSHQSPSNSNSTPMEVDHSRGQRFRPQYHKFKKVNSAQGPRQVKCWHCGRLGHISRDCKEKQEQRPPMGHGRPRHQWGQNQNNRQEN